MDSQDNIVSVRYLLLRKIDSIAFNIEHATELEAIIRSVEDIEVVYTNCIPLSLSTQIFDKLSTKKILTLLVPSPQLIKPYLYRINVVPLVVAIKKDKELWKNIIESTKEVLKSRVIGNVVPLLPRAMYDRIRLIKLMIDYSLFNLIHPTLGLDIFKEFLSRDTKCTTAEISLIDKIYNKHKDIVEFWLEWIGGYVMQNTIGPKVLHYKLEQGYILRIAQLLEKNIQRGKNCEEKIATIQLTDFLFEVLQVPYIHKLWTKISETFTAATSLTRKVIEA